MIRYRQTGEGQGATHARTVDRVASGVKAPRSGATRNHAPRKGVAVMSACTSKVKPPEWMDRPMVANARRNPASPKARSGRLATSPQLLLPSCATSKPACPDHRVFSTAKSSASSNGS